ncbi:MAG: DNA polymerase III subunit gamma/tau [Intestinibacillus sp.]
MYQALYRKWRPLRFADVIGQKHITDTLRSQLKSGRLSHAYLFTGTRGTGKTTCAKILARAVNCERPIDGDPCNECPSCRGILDGSVLDVLEIDAASNNGVDNIRDIRDESQYTPASVKKRVYIIDEVHMLSQGAFNALLKTLEEPPPHVLFILATTEIHKVPATILSRCQRFDFRRITSEDIAARLLAVAQEEQILLTEGGAKLIARLSDGAMRDALSMLDRTAAGGETVDENTVSRSVGILGGERAAELMDCIRTGALERAISLIGECYVDGRDLSAVLDQLLGLIRDMLLVKTAGGDVGAMLSPAYSEQTVRRLCEGCAASTLIAYTRMIQESLMRMKNAANRRVEAELCIIRLCSLGADDYDSLSGRVDALEEKVKNGIPAAAPVRTVPDNDRPPPPGETDAPPWDEAAPQAAPKQKLVPKEKKTDAASAEWPLWPKLLTSLTGKISNAAHVNLKLSARGALQDNVLWIYADDSVTAMLAAAVPTRDAIAREASALVGQQCVVKIREAAQEQSDEDHGGFDEILKNARKQGIEITEL